MPVRLAVVDPARAGLGVAATDVLAATAGGASGAGQLRPGVAGAGHPRCSPRTATATQAPTVLDLFPHTPHVEVVTVFDR